jgi:hypothetical protein
LRNGHVFEHAILMVNLFLGCEKEDNNSSEFSPVPLENRVFLCVGKNPLNFINLKII